MSYLHLLFLEVQVPQKNLSAVFVITLRIHLLQLLVLCLCRRRSPHQSAQNLVLQMQAPKQWHSIRVRFP